MKKKRTILLDDLPSPPPPPKKKLRKEPPKNVRHDYNIYSPYDMSGTLLVEKWQSAWKYCDNNVRVMLSNNPNIPENTTFSNSKAAAIILRKPCYFNIHKAIINDTELNGCVLEYTTTKLKNVNHYLRGDGVK